MPKGESRGNPNAPLAAGTATGPPSPTPCARWRLTPSTVAPCSTERRPTAGRRLEIGGPRRPAIHGNPRGHLPGPAARRNRRRVPRRNGPVACVGRRLPHPRGRESPRSDGPRGRGLRGDQRRGPPAGRDGLARGTSPRRSKRSWAYRPSEIHSRCTTPRSARSTGRHSSNCSRSTKPATWPPRTANARAPPRTFFKESEEFSLSPLRSPGHSPSPLGTPCGRGSG